MGSMGISFELGEKPYNVDVSYMDKIMPDRHSLNALSFFSGCMGLDLGLEQEGIKMLLACEVNPAARKTIEINRPDIALLGDIKNFSSALFRWWENGLLPQAGLE